MATLQVKVDDAFLVRMTQALNPCLTDTEVMQEALTLLNWAAEEKNRGRVILSARPDGSDVERLAMGSLALDAATEKAMRDAKGGD